MRTPTAGVLRCTRVRIFTPLYDSLRKNNLLTACAGVNAHNHQHLFCLRINPNIDGAANSVYMVDAVPSDAPVGSPENFYGNAFYAKRTRLETAAQSMTDYNGATSRTWDMVNESKLNPHSGRPVSYKLVSREVPGLLPKEGSLVWKRAAFARHAVHVTECKYMTSPQTFRNKVTDISSLSKTPTTSSGLQAVTSRRHPESLLAASQSGSAMAAEALSTRILSCGTASVSPTSPLPRTSL